MTNIVYCRITRPDETSSCSAGLTPERAWELYHKGYIITPWRTA